MSTEDSVTFTPAEMRRRQRAVEALCEEQSVDALLIFACIVIFAGGVLAQGHASGASARPTAASSAGDRP